MRRRAGGAASIALLAALLVAPVAPAPPVVVASTVSSHAQPAKTGTQAPRWAAGLDRALDERQREDREMGAVEAAGADRPDVAGVLAERVPGQALRFQSV